jgi:PAS domain S-box-containing protein
MTYIKVKGPIDNNTFLNFTVLQIIVIGHLSLLSGIILLNWFLKDVVFENEMLHSTIEASGAIISLMIAILILILSKQNQIAPIYSWMAYGFISMGIFDFLHASVLPGNLFVWLHSITVLSGGMLFSAICLPQKTTEFFRKYPVSQIVLISIVFLVIFSLFFPQNIPLMFENNRFTLTARLFNITGGLLFLGAFFHFLIRLKNEQLMDDFIFVNLSFLFGIAGLLFETSQIWSVDWWYWHLIRLIAYSFCFYYLCLNYYRINIKLQSEIKVRKLAEEELLKLSQAIKQSGSAVVITDLKGKIEYVNPAFTNVSGYSTSEAMRKNINFHKSGQHPDKLYEEMWDTILDGQVWRGEMINKRKNGDLYWEYATISPVVDHSGKVSHFVAINDDITQRKQLEYKLIIAKKEAETANETKSEFLANISHEIRTPMHQILSYSKFGIDKIDTVAKEKLHHYFSRIHLSGKNLLILMNNLLDLSKIESGKMNYDMAKNDLQQIIENVSDEFTSLIDEKELLLSVNKTDLSTSVVCDEPKIGQVFRNLLSNAIKFTPNKKKITISIGLGKLQDKKGTTRSAVLTSIKDEGLGIPIGELNTVFDRFIQSSKTKTGAGGTGLGLAISRDIIEAHGGRVWAENNPERGSIFKVLLPCD